MGDMKHYGITQKYEKNVLIDTMSNWEVPDLR